MFGEKKKSLKKKEKNPKPLICYVVMALNPGHSRSFDCVYVYLAFPVILSCDWRRLLSGVS